MAPYLHYKVKASGRVVPDVLHRGTVVEGPARSLSATPPTCASLMLAYHPGSEEESSDVKCPQCGAEAPLDSNFCHRCAARLPTGTGDGPITERRVVSVLFADLQGFTAFAATRDPEDVREVLTRFCDVANTVIARYGGVTEKFIGDAVMAVWGTPIAMEDDPDRAVKAALELVACVSKIEFAPGEFLAVRAGIVTGEAAVTLGARGQGMVAGDMVNTASRIQTAAPAGCVYVDDNTHAATEVAIAYRDAGEHTLKGKPHPVHIWHAEGVVRVMGIEPPFVARDRDLRMISDAYEHVVSSGKAGFVVVTGRTGIGKTRLSLEFQRYLNTLPAAGTVYIGHSTPFGEGASFGGLRDIFRQILGVTADADVETVVERIQAVLDVGPVGSTDAGWVLPRVLQALFPDASRIYGQDELFAAWRTILESAAATSPIVLVIEEWQWASESASAFLHTILRWSSNSPILILALARTSASDDGSPMAAEAVRVALSDLETDALEKIAVGLAPDLNREIVRHLATSAEGLPLYIVESLRMLATSGLLARGETTYRVVHQPDQLAVPHTMQLVIAARLDALSADASELVKTAAVLGIQADASTIALIEGRRPAALTPLLNQLVQDEILIFNAGSGDADGVYSFAQRLLHDVVYERISRRDRVERHLMAAQVLGSRQAKPVSAEVVAHHYLRAYALDGSREGALEGARATLLAAVEDARAAANLDGALRYCAHALEIAGDDESRARFAVEAGDICYALGRFKESYAHHQTARRLAASCAEEELALRATVQAARVAYTMARNGEALDMLRDAYQNLAPDASLRARALLAHRLSWSEFFGGNLEAATPLTEEACELYAWVGDVEGIGWASGARASVLAQRGRRLESRYAFELARETGAAAGSVFMQIYIRVWEADAHIDLGDFDHEQQLEAEIADLARRLGSEGLAETGRGLSVPASFYQGRWDEALRKSQDLDLIMRIPQRGPWTFHGVGLIYSHRAKWTEADELAAVLESAKDPNMVFAVVPSLLRGALALDRGDARAALQEVTPQLQRLHNAGPVKLLELAFAIASEAAWSIGEWNELSLALALVEAEWPGRSLAPLRGQMALARAHQLGRYDTTMATHEFDQAIVHFRDAGQPYDLAVALATYALWGSARGIETAAEWKEAERLFDDLGATVWRARLAQANGSMHRAAD
jgi:class 3 adenylate cyclase/tetratricopeptide (TPR) repeat protein